jgi:hypothetical protein
MPRIVCPSCRKKFHPPDHLAGRRVMCPRCDGVIVVPTDIVQAMEEAASVETPAASDKDVPFPLAARLGIISLVLGMISYVLICAPVASYLSIGLSSIGLLLGLAGLFRARTDSEPLPPSIAGGVGLWGGFGTRVRHYPLAGIVACLVILFFSLLPTLIEWLFEQ